MHPTNAELSRHLRPRRPSRWYGLAALTVITGFCSVVPRAVSFAADGRLNALRPVPSDASLRHSLLLVARPKVEALRHKLSKRGAVGESNGVFFRAPECQVGSIAGSRITRNGPTIAGLVTVSCVWKSTAERTFRDQDEAEQAELTEREPGRLRLTFAWTEGKWLYKGAKKEMRDLYRPDNPATFCVCMFPIGDVELDTYKGDHHVTQCWFCEKKSGNHN